MYMLRKKFRRQFNLVLGLLSLVLVVAIAACGSPDATSTGCVSTDAAGGAMPTEFRIGYQLIPNAEVLLKVRG